MYYDEDDARLHRCAGAPEGAATTPGAATAGPAARPQPRATTPHAAGDDVAERCAYLQGARSGRLAGFCWGLLLGAASVAAALELGRMLG